MTKVETGQKGESIAANILRGCGVRFITDRDEAKCVPCQREDAPY